MAYILKNAGPLISSRVTDAGREKLSQGNFNISYFQIGDSEITYNELDSSYSQVYTEILEPCFNSQNSTGVPNSNKQSVKYPLYVDGSAGNTYGIPFMDSKINSIFNTAKMRGFFTYDDSISYGEVDNTQTVFSWSALTNNEYVVSSNILVPMSAFTGDTTCLLLSDTISGNCNTNEYKSVSIGDYMTIFFDGFAGNNCYCEPFPGTTTTTTTNCNPSSSTCPIPPEPQCVVSTNGCYPMLTFKVINKDSQKIYFDKKFPKFPIGSTCGYVRLLFYPKNMLSLYDNYTPRLHWRTDVIDYESICGKDEFDVKVWNMNIPWSETPAGINESLYKGYQNFPSKTFLGTKEYLGYSSNSGQTDSGVVYHYNSFEERVVVTPEEQKAIAIIHYTNQTIDFFYGEKFAMEAYVPSNTNNTTGQGREFKLHLPWLMWHKSNTTTCNCFGETFWVDPPGFDSLSLFQVNYIKSTKNSDMNDPGIRYYNLWDINENSIDGYPNRVGKVFPDQKIIVIDDEELIAAMSHISNRNWTLPSPKLSLVTPNILVSDGSSEGLLTGKTETLYVSYLLYHDELNMNSLHCNYYPTIKGPDIVCAGISSQDVGVRFGGEFGCLSQPKVSSGQTFDPKGYYANKFKVICQKVSGNERPNPSQWKIIDFTDTLSAKTINSCITQSGLTGSTFVITKNLYNNSPYYNLNNYITLPSITDTNNIKLSFGDEYYFYGSLETDIEGTIYEMDYKINLSQNEFKVSSNPTWSTTKSPFITEIGLFDSNKTLMVMSKVNYPIERSGLQQFSIKLDF